GQIPYEYGFPNPVVTQFRWDSPPQAVPDSGILIINKRGEILAYRFNGDSYFYSMGGLFASMDARVSDAYSMGGGTSPFVTAADLNGDDFIEVVASFTSPYPYTGLGIFQGANGEPAFGMESPIVQNMSWVNGTILADLNGDYLPEIITSGNDSTRLPKIWVKTNGSDDLPGWPIELPDVADWIASYPIAADLDLDGVPEILNTYFEWDISALYIFKADGTPYIQHEGRPIGEAYVQPVTFGTPMVANLTGDEYPEIVMRSGYILPGTGLERVYILDHLAQPLPGWPIITPAHRSWVYSSRYAPLIDDIDSDGLVELVIISDANELLVWNFDASYNDGQNTERFLVDNLNSGILPPWQNPTDVPDGRAFLPASIVLHQNYPNPFNPMTHIRFDLPSRSKIRLSVYNILGQEVAELIDRDLGEGKHEVVFDGSRLASGVYFYRLKADESVLTKKMLLVK
ncbi:MAG: T9SS type A sorting domain-containing protein, partial [Candidatus Zixiibacteriota bacterium]